jgi:hypothetical protein
MSKEAAPDRDALTKRVGASLRKAESMASDLRKGNTRLLVASMVSSAIVTLVAGITSAQGPVIGEGIPGWRAACIVAAAFGLISTITTGLNQQLKMSDRLSEGTLCVGRLKSLDVTITTGSKSWEEIVREFEEIAKTHPEYIS